MRFKNRAGCGMPWKLPPRVDGYSGLVGMMKEFFLQMMKRKKLCFQKRRDAFSVWKVMMGQTAAEVHSMPVRRCVCSP